MSELNFCPFCDAPKHKVMLCKEDLYFCKLCSRFFTVKPVTMKCLRCDSGKVKASDFPSPTGETIFQCSSCKKMFSAKEFFELNQIV